MTNLYSETRESGRKPLKDNEEAITTRLVKEFRVFPMKRLICPRKMMLFIGKYAKLIERGLFPNKGFLVRVHLKKMSAEGVVQAKCMKGVVGIRTKEKGGISGGVSEE